MIELRVCWGPGDGDDGDSTFLTPEHIEVTLEPHGDPPTQSDGQVAWMLPDTLVGQQLRLRVTLHYEGGATGATRATTPVQIDQMLRMEGDGSIRFDNTSGPWAGACDPRCTFEPAGAADHGSVRLRIDLSFFDVTDALTGIWDADEDEGLVAMWEIVVAHGGRLRLFQYAWADDPHVWAVYVPSALRQDVPEVPVLVYFTPFISIPNESLATAVHRSAVRYFARREGPYWGYTYPYDDDNPASDSWVFSWHPPARLMDQVDASGKAVVLVLPYYGRSGFGGAAESALVPRLRSLLVALRSGSFEQNEEGAFHRVQLVAAAAAVTDALELGRLGIAGFSSGGVAATLAWKANQSHVSELYLFDPAGEDPSGGDADGLYRLGSYRTALGDWLAGSGRAEAPPIPSGERLRLLGGDYLSTLVSTRDRLADRGDVRVWPSSSDFFLTSRVYKHAFISSHPEPGFDTVQAHELADVGSTSELSTFTGVYRDPDQSVGPAMSLIPDFGGQASPPLGEDDPYGLIEISTYVALARHWFSNFEDEPLRNLVTQADFNRLIADVTHSRGQRNRHRRDEEDWDQDDNREEDGFYVAAVGAPAGYGRRHQWPAFGGESDTDDPEVGFRGYLQMCLDTSGY